MTKKKQALFQHATAVSLVLLLLFGMAMPAFGQPRDGNTLIGREDAEIEAVIAKRLLTSYFTNPPLPLTFTFKFTELSFTPDDEIFESNGYNHPVYEFGSHTKADNMPLPDDITITIDSSSDTTVELHRPSGRKSLWRESGDIFAGTDWPEAGIYCYSLKETGNTFTAHTNKDEYVDWMLFSPAVYYIEVYVVEADWETDPSDDGYYIAALAMRLSTDPDEIDFWWEEIIEEDDDYDLGDKIDPSSFEKKGNGDYSDAVFTNRYFKDNSGEKPDPKDPEDPDDDDTVFRLDKEVPETDGADRGIYFDFEITVTQPTFQNETPAPEYRAFVLEEVGEPAVRTYVVSTNNGTFETAGAGDPADYILFVSGTPQTVSLKHGQWLALVDAPEGSAIAIEEKGELGYTASYELMLNGGLTGTNSSREYTGIVKGAESGDHGFPPYSTVVPSGLTFQTAFIGEPLNWATFTNTYKYIPITGIAMDNMPYYILIGLAVLGFAAYVMVRLRRNARYATQPQAQTH